MSRAIHGPGRARTGLALVAAPPASRSRTSHQKTVAGGRLFDPEIHTTDSGKIGRRGDGPGGGWGATVTPAGRSLPTRSARVPDGGESGVRVASCRSWTRGYCPASGCQRRNRFGEPRFPQATFVTRLAPPHFFRSARRSSHESTHQDMIMRMRTDVPGKWPPHVPCGTAFVDPPIRGVPHARVSDPTAHRTRRGWACERRADCWHPGRSTSVQQLALPHHEHRRGHLPSLATPAAESRQNRHLRRGRIRHRGTEGTEKGRF